jgi:AraC-like DNA-binding protein
MYLIGKKHSLSSIGSKAKKTELLINLRWIILLLTILLVVIVNYLVIIASLIQSKPSETLTSFYPIYITSGIAFYFLSLSLLLFPNILYGIPEFIAISSKKKKKKKKPLIEIATPIESDFYQDLSERMKKYLTTEKPFTNPNFKISDIAIALHVTQNEVFYCINEVLKTKFSDLKSELRIKFAVELLTSDFKKTLTIEGIAKQSGFNSRGIFYSAFKKIMGITPTEYISNLKNE